MRQFIMRLKKLKQEPLTAAADGFVICQEQVPGKGEDFFLYERRPEAVLMAVFDGSGGSGARVYPEFGNHTGAYVASRVLAEAVKLWFDCESKRIQRRLAGKNNAESDEKEGKESAEAGLKKAMDDALHRCREKSGSGPMLLGSLKKEFPSTMAMFLLGEQRNRAVFCWCGDSRGYVLDSQGLHQVTADDTEITDAMVNLREDAPMTNVASASHPYQIHWRQAELKQPSILLAATDGCFSYLPTPMEFEKLLLETMMESSSLKKWRAGLIRRIEAVAGDDFTMGICLQGFQDFEEAKQSLRERLDDIREKFPLDEKTEEKELFRQWEIYRKSYEKLMERRQDGD